MERGTKQFLFLSFLILSLGACGSLSSSSLNNTGTASTGDSSTGDASTDSSGQSLAGEGVSALTIDSSSGDARVSFGSLKGTEEYILGVYSYSEDGSSGNSIGLASVNDSSHLSGLTNNISVDDTGEISDDVDENVTEDFHQMLREQEESLSNSNSSSTVRMLGATKINPTPALGAVRNFEVYNSLTSTSTTVTTTSTLIAITPNLECWRDNDAVSLMSDQDVIEMCNKVDFYIPAEEALFHAMPSDVDGNGRVILHFTSTVNQIGAAKIGAASGGIVTAYFSAGLLSKDGEALQMLVPDDQGSKGPVIKHGFYQSNFWVVPLHEFQHVMSYNMHVLVNHGSPEKPAWNEAASHFAEGIPSIIGLDGQPTTGTVGSDGGLPPVISVGPENASRVSRFLDQTDSICFTCGASLTQRGGSFLFFRLMYELAKKQLLTGSDPATSGADFLARFENNDKVGVENIVNSATGNTEDIGATFTNLLGQFAVSLLGTGHPIDGMDLYAKQDDNRGTNLQGPTLHDVTSFPLSATLGATSIGYYRITADQITKAGGLLSLHVGDTNNVGAFVVQTNP